MIKRTFDVLVSATLLILLSPLMLLEALVIAITMGQPVLFRQSRPGLNGKLFTLYKFRTMTNDVDSDGNLLPVLERITPVGYFARKSSIDELPELLNVFKGDMSMVGPRPLLPEYMELYTPEQARRHEVRPGITGLAQISGRHYLPFSKRLQLDVYYVDHQSLWFDLKILLLTIPSVLGARGTGHLGSDAVDDIGLLPDSKLGLMRLKRSEMGTEDGLE